MSSDEVEQLRARVTELEQEQRRAKRREQSLLRALPQQVVWRTDAQGRVEGESLGWEALTGQTAEQARGEGWLEAVHPDDRAKVRERWQRAVADRTEFHHVHRLRLADGQYQFFEARGAPVRGEDGQVEGWIGVSGNVDLVYRMEMVLRGQEVLFRKMFDEGPLPMLLADPAGKLVRANDSLRQLLGYSAEEMESLTLAELAVPEDAALDRQIVENIFRGNLSKSTLEKRFRTREGEPVWVRVSESAIHDAQGKPAYLMATIEDIHQRKMLEEELQQQTKELLRSNQELQQFAFVVSHDLQEPLRAVRGYTQLLKRRFAEQLPRTAQEFLEQTQQGVDRMTQLIDDLLTYSQVATQTQQDYPPVPLAVPLSWAVMNLGYLIESSGASIRYEDLPEVRGDQNRLAQLFQNLIGNALKYRSERTPEIEISAQACDGEWVIAVRDNGVGIDPQHHERIFGVFKRLHGKEIPGTGIGLAICKRIVERHGGRIWVESAPGQGSTFLFTLPR